MAAADGRTLDVLAFLITQIEMAFLATDSNTNVKFGLIMGLRQTARTVRTVDTIGHRIEEHSVAIVLRCHYRQSLHLWLLSADCTSLAGSSSPRITGASGTPRMSLSIDTFSCSMSQV